MHHLCKDLELQDDFKYPQNPLVIQDNAMFHMLSNIPPTCGEICLGILDQMSFKKNFIFSTDSYSQTSIKSQERRRRGVSEKVIINSGLSRTLCDFKSFLNNDANKQRLSELLLEIWSPEAHSRLEKIRFAMLIVDGKAHILEWSGTQVR